MIDNITGDLKDELQRYRGDKYTGNPLSLCEYMDRQYLAHVSSHKSCSLSQYITMHSFKCKKVN